MGLNHIKGDLAGYWPSSLACFSMEPDTIEVHTLENERGQYPSILTEQA